MNSIFNNQDKTLVFTSRIKLLVLILAFESLAGFIFLFREHFKEYASIYAPVIASMLTLIGTAYVIYQTNKGNNERLLKQLDHDRVEKERERNHTLKKLRVERAYDYQRQTCVQACIDIEEATVAMLNLKNLDQIQLKTLKDKHVIFNLLAYKTKLAIAGAVDIHHHYCKFIEKFIERFTTMLSICERSAPLQTAIKNARLEIEEMEIAIKQGEYYNENMTELQPGLNGIDATNSTNQLKGERILKYHSLVKLLDRLENLKLEYDTCANTDDTDIALLHCNLIESVRKNIGSEFVTE